MKNFFSILIAMFIVSNTIQAAQKIDTVFTASGKKHKLYYSIPDNYDASKQYPMVVGLHYCGGSGIQYRNALTLLSDSLNYIVVCPDNSSNQIPDANIDIITAAADTARSAFNIDAGSMYLTGMSCNGEVTFRQGMNKFYPFRGIFPWVPWISDNNFSAYKLDSDMPIVLAVGTYDSNFKTLMSLYDSLKANAANVNLVLVPGVGHTLSFNEFGATMIHCIKYLNSAKNIEIAAAKPISMINTDEEKQVEIPITASNSKNIKVKQVLSVNGVFESTTTYDKTSNKAIVKIKPVAGKSGVGKIVIEASEAGDSAIAQTVINVRVDKNVSVKNEEMKALKTTLAPNPAKGQVVLSTPSTANSFELLDISGKILIQVKASGSQTMLDISKYQ
ncbi:MAG TPA: hypothetical protein VIO15_07415, partial [Bacteroidales bacterium]